MRTAMNDGAIDLTDPLLRHTSAAAKALRRAVERQPTERRVEAMDRALASLDEKLPHKVRAMASAFRARGLAEKAAIERAVTLALAEASVDAVVRTGYQVKEGGRPEHSRASNVLALQARAGRLRDEAHEEMLKKAGPRALRAGGVVGTQALRASTGVGSWLRGLGSSTTEEEKSPEEVVGTMFQSMLCSRELQGHVTDVVGRNEGADAAGATGIGFEVGRSLALCPAPTTPAATAPAPVASSDTSLVAPIAIGVGALVVVGGLVWWSSRKR